MKKIFKLLILIGAVVFSSCEDQLNLTNPNQITTETFFLTETDFEQALISAYVSAKSGLAGGYTGTRCVMLRNGRSDEIEFRNDIKGIFQVSRFTNDADNYEVALMFSQCYRGIYRCNLIEEKLAEKDFSQEFKDKIMGEAYFLRAFYFHILAREFKDVPIRLTASQDAATFPMEKSSQSEVFAQALSDLAKAEPLLPVITDAASAKGKPSRGSAKALAGQIYIEMGDWANAKAQLEPLTKSPYEYELVEYGWNFDEAHEYNKESVFEIIFDLSGGTSKWGDGEDVNATQSNTIAKEYAAAEVGGWFEAWPTQTLMDALWKEKDLNGDFDVRGRMTVAWNYPGCMYYLKPFTEVFAPEKHDTYWWTKYQNAYTSEGEGDSRSSINERYLRYAHVICNLAEAEIELGNADAAINLLNQIRRRANLADYSGDSGKASLKEELIHQKFVEFAKEGVRFYDLRRWGMLEEALQEQDPIRAQNFMAKHYYFPLPNKEVQNNPLLGPSEGW
ncbi:MAG: RagB/SusD family nutrient uptake outer membrane protein [Draconibacterium sp.]